MLARWVIRPSDPGSQHIILKIDKLLVIGDQVACFRELWSTRFLLLCTRNDQLPFPQQYSNITYFLCSQKKTMINMSYMFSGQWTSDACHWSVDDVPASQIRWHRIAHSYHPANHISRAVGSDPFIGSIGLLLHCQRQSAFALLGKLHSFNQFPS